MIRVAIFGLGKAALQLHGPACAALPEAVELVAGCEPDPLRREQAGRQLRIPAVYAEAEALLEQEKPDLVIISTPPQTHRDLCLLALQHGAHIVCEKPFAANVAEADEVIAAAESRELSVVVNNQYRYLNIYRLPQEHIAAGAYGKPFLIQVWQQMLHPPSRESNWRAELVQSSWYEFGTHPLDLCCFFFGALPVSITAHTPHPDAELAADVLVQATLRFPQERLATVLLNRISHASTRYLEMRVDCERASVRIAFGGLARAGVEWSSGLGRPTGRFSLVRGGEARAEDGGRSCVIAREWSDNRALATAQLLRGVIAAIINGTASNVQARHARELIRIVQAGYESARTGETVWLTQSKA